MEYSIIMPGATVEKGAEVKYAIVAENARICAGAKIGNTPEEVKDNWGVAVVAPGITVGKNAVVAAKEMPDQDIPDVE